MAESKSGIFAKQLQKHIVRTKTKVLQNLGKAEKTKDDELDIHLTNFQKQQHDAARLQKDLRQFIHCARELAEASKILQNTMQELYEEEWEGNDKLTNINESLELLWLDYVQRLNSSVLPSLVSYSNHFPESKAKIAKRGRKLTDFDNSRHNLDALVAAKKKDDAKILKAQDECNESKRIYDELNNELHDELPALYDKRVGVYASTFHTLYASTTTMYAESAKLHSQLAEMLESLSKEHERGELHPKRSPMPRPPRPASTNKRPSSLNDSADSAHSDDQSPHLATNDVTDEKKVIGSSTFYTVTLKPSSDVNSSTIETPVTMETEATPAVSMETELERSEAEAEESSDTESEEVPVKKKPPPRPSPAPRLSHIDDTNAAGKRNEQAVSVNLATVARHASEGTLDRQSRVKESAQEQEEEEKGLAEKRKSESSVSVPSRGSTLDSRPSDNSNASEVDVDEALKELDMNIDVGDVIEDHVTEPANHKPADEAAEKGKDEKEEDEKEETKEEEKKALPEGVLFQVRVTHKYAAQEDDELALDPGDVINVVTVEEEGWLLGYKEGSEVQGVFPENFTKRVE